MVEDESMKDDFVSLDEKWSMEDKYNPLGTVFSSDDEVRRNLKRLYGASDEFIEKTIRARAKKAKQ